MKKLIICIMAILLCGCAGVSNSVTEPTVYIAEEFLDILKQEQAGSTWESNDKTMETGSMEAERDSQQEEEKETVERASDKEFSFEDLNEEEILEALENPIGAIMQCLPDREYYSRASYELTSQFATLYLQKIASLYEREHAVSYGRVTGTSYESYVCWSREQVGFYLDVMFGGQFTEDDLMCDGDSLLYYNEQYYVGIPEALESIHTTVRYEKEDDEHRADYVYLFLEEDNGRERRSGRVIISILPEQLVYSDRYIFEMIIEEE